MAIEEKETTIMHIFFDGEIFNVSETKNITVSKSKLTKKKR